MDLGDVLARISLKPMWLIRGENVSPASEFARRPSIPRWILHTYTHTHIHARTRTDTYTHTHIHTHTHTHTCIHTYIYAPLWSSREGL